MKKWNEIVLYALVGILFTSLWIIAATVIWNAFAPQMLGVPRANARQMGLALLFHLTFTGKFWVYLRRRMHQSKKATGQT